MNREMEITIDISKHPDSRDGLKEDGSEYYYDGENGERVNLAETDYPPNEGTYKKLTHTPQNGNVIGKITKGSADLKGFDDDLYQHKTASVYFWSCDIGYEKPLLIQLGDGDVYYTTTKGGTSWSNAPGIKESTLKSELDRQNCYRNHAHGLYLSESGGGIHACTGCGTSITVSRSTLRGGYPKCRHSIPSESGGFKVATVSYGGTLLKGLSSSIPLNSLTVYFSDYGDLPLLIELEKSDGSSMTEYVYYARDNGTGSTWTELDKRSSKALTEPLLILKLDDLKKKLEASLPNAQARRGRPDTSALTKGIIGLLIGGLCGYAAIKLWPTFNDFL